MISEEKTIVITGKLEKNIYGTWDDVEKGLFVDDSNLESILYELINKKVNITITEITN